MKKYALIGGKLGHSYSEEIHKIYFELCGINGNYTLIETQKQNLKSCIENMKKSGICGFNVTIPYKSDCIPLLDKISDEAQKIGAVNTVKFSADGIFGYNTDYFGIIKTFERFNIDISGKEIVILGTGGACKAVCAACVDLGAKNITLVSRNAQKNSHFKIVSYDDKISGDVLINATPVGMYPNINDTPLQDIDKKFDAVFDLIYNPAKTELLKIAESKNIKAVNGLYMLVAQAMRAQEIWNETKVDDEITEKIYTALNNEKSEQ